MDIPVKITCTRDCEAKNRVQEEKEIKKKVNKQAKTKFTRIIHYQENMPLDPTQKQRNKSNSRTLNVDKKPPKEMTRNSPAESPIMLRRKLPMAWGTTIDRVTTEINPFPYERETKHLTLKDPETYLILDG